MGYQPLYPAGSRVLIAGADVLQRYMRHHYKYHHPMTDAHLEHANESHIVSDVGMYFGGDQLYVLEKLPRLVWLEECLITDPGA